MEYLNDFLDWAERTSTANLFSTIATIVGFPGAIWGIYLFIRWVRGTSVDATISKIRILNASIEDETKNLRAEFREWAISQAKHKDSFSTSNHQELAHEKNNRSRTLTLEDIKEIASKALVDLPSEIRGLTKDLRVLVRDYPDRAMLEKHGLTSGFDLISVFEGTPLTEQSSTSRAPTNLVWIFRTPIIDFAEGHAEPVDSVVRHAVVHGLAKHIGLGETEIEAIEAAAG